MKIPKRPHFNENHDRIEAFVSSPAFAEICEQLRPRLDPNRHFTHTVEGFLRHVLCIALSRSDLQERATTGDRKKLAQEIIDSSTRLEIALENVWQENGFEFPFQGHLDYLALELANEDYASWKRDDAVWDDQDEDIVHRCRYAIYFALMQRMGDILATFRMGAEQLVELKPTIKQPHGANADRLFFIRKATEKFFRLFGTPCRSTVLRLTEAFFDCDDLDEAALSKLAPTSGMKPEAATRISDDGKAQLAEVVRGLKAKGADLSGLGTIVRLAEEFEESQKSIQVE